MKRHLLLTRDAFRQAVFARDRQACVACFATGPLDAHHIYERRLWDDGGYYLDNGASLCERCHRDAESTLISVEQLHGLIRAVDPPRPSCLTADGEYDKWGNAILAEGRARGPLYHRCRDTVHDGVVFTRTVKYPRTMHLPWSEGMTSDDRQIHSLAVLRELEVVVTEKMDGENTTMYSDLIHARSVQPLRPLSARSYVKKLHGLIRQDIPEGWRVCGENMQGVHSIRYENLDSYFLGFSVWDDSNTCLSWYDTLDWFQLLQLTHVPVLFHGSFAEFEKSELVKGTFPRTKEGYVVRPTKAFHLNEFQRCVAKFVRRDHVTTTEHWAHGEIEFNGLRDPSVFKG